MRRRGGCEQRGCKNPWDTAVFVGWRVRFLCIGHAEKWSRRHG